MVEINPETQKTRRERLATVISIGVSALVHLFILVGGVQIYQWAEEEEERQRLMVVRFLQEGVTEAQQVSREIRGRRPAPPEAEIKELGPDEPPEETRRSEEMTDELSDGGEELPPEEETEEIIGTTVSVVTDLSRATFTVSGPEVHSGTGTFWTKKDLPPGDYTATFHPVAGHKTPPISTKTLEERSRIVFVGKYTRSVEVEVKVNNVTGATFSIRRPDGQLLGMTRPGRAFFENIPLGAYTITFNDVTGYLTPAPQTKSLEKGGRLAFVGSYFPVRKTVAVEGESVRAPARLDRRVQMIVKSYPPTSIENDFDTIRYPEIIIKRSNFQRGWCRVYLVLRVDGSGRVGDIKVERPRGEEREQYSRLIEAVEGAVRSWSYDSSDAEVHVDVRFFVE